MKSPLLVLVLAGAAVAQDFAKVKVEAKPVADKVWMLTGQGGNIGVLAGDDGVVLIDDQFAPLAEKIRAAVTGVSAKPIRFLLNTHFHGDHAGGNAEFGKTGTLILAHENVRKRLSARQFSEFLKKETPPQPPAGLPVVTFPDSLSVHLNGETLTAVHVPPAHTDGDTFIFFEKANVVHTGDVFNSGGYPFIDGGSGGNMDGMVAAIDILLGRIDDRTRVIPGHGPVTDKKKVQEYREMLAGIRDVVKKLKGEGKSEQEVVAARPTAAYDAVWGKTWLKGENFAKLAYQVTR